MARTTPALVQAMLQQDYDTLNSPDLNQYITGANLFVNKVVSLIKWQTYTPPGDQPATAEYLERLIACHLYQMADPAYKQKSTSSASGGFLGQDGKGLEATRYGMMALRQDTSGCVEALDKRKVAHAFWGGSCPAPVIGGGGGYF